MSYGAKHPLVLKSLQATPAELKGKELTSVEFACSMADCTRCVRESVSGQFASTVGFFKRDQLALRIKQLDKRIAYWEARAEELEREAAQGGGHEG
ncbi:MULTISPECIES: hypothetical protein [Xanthomonas]|uniref:Uncharacterized protein n=1 Tax=Xanthomonas campestris pv. glycines TaxID=473421 RepID=A0AAX0I4Z6_XANCG|nr:MULTISPECIES: hypothetical protein [Xanthomonas]AOY63415.1 hypothetical protein BHE84_15470 [Xanthomonas citri pv. glycines str. 8ra]OEY98635.1 hypothetical protein BIY41_09715 [Xanthomonas citri pv. glycines]OOW99963.1 hypothetical protein Xgly_03005 [Xanthomonas citri pv. glycines]QDR44934.1 hypothetical protein FPK90_09675 [Xanthomonas citri pv. glycines]QDS11404.1 hypothetical protein FPL03_09665 [Xanthomonas citri pv. glycines]